MMKFFGAIFIFAACFYIGFIKARAFKMREINMSAVTECLFHIRSSIAFSNDTLPELLSKLSAQFDGQAGEFFSSLCLQMDRIGETSFANIWTEVIKSCFSELGASEFTELSKLGQTIGRCDAATQIKAISDCEAYFSRGLEQIRCELPQKRKLALGLSATAGAFAVILLV